MGLLHHPLGMFVFQAILIIGASRLLGRVARSIGQPLVIAEIAAGVVLGPSLLGAMSPDVMAAVFPKASMPALGLVSQVGLVLFMFLVGLEFDTRLLRGRAHSSVAISHASIIVPFALGSLAAISLDEALAPPDVPFTSFLLFMGVSMSVTAFPVLARILSESRLLGTRIGSVALTCAAIDDVTAWCLLAFVVAVVRTSGLSAAFMTTGLTLAYVAGMLLVVRPVLARFARGVEARAGLTPDAMALVLVLVLVSSLATDVIGVHALFGAFVVGAVLPNSGGLKERLAEKLEDVVVVFFLPLFFAYSGLRTEIGLLDEAREWAICGLLILLATLGKFGGSFFAARLTGLSWRESAGLGVLMNTRGLMELVVLNIGLDLGVISPTVFTMMVIMALVTTFATSPILRLLYPNAAVAHAGPAATSSASLTARPLLVCVDVPASGPELATLARALVQNDDAPAVALHIVDPERAIGRIEAERGEAALAPLMSRAHAIGLDVSPLSFVSAHAADEIVALAGTKQAELVLVPYERAFLGGGVGTTIANIMARSPVTVAALVERGLEEMGRVLVPLTGATADDKALRLAVRLTRGADSHLTILCVGRSGTALASLRARARLLGGDRAEILGAEAERVDDAVATEARRGRYDLVVAAVGEASGVSTSTFELFAPRLIEDAPCSVLVVSPPAPVDASPAASSVEPAVVG